jgi:hypothetical protein
MCSRGDLLGGVRVNPRRLLMILAAGLGLMDSAVARAATPVAEALVHSGPPPIIDGRLDEAVWAKARPIDGLVQDEPVEGMRSTERTDVRLLVDALALYVGACLYDSRPEAIIARLDRRDGGTANDSFTLYLDPLRDGRTGVYFGVSASGTQHDGTMSNEDWRDDTWNPVWDARSRATGPAGPSRCASLCHSCGSTPLRGGAGASICGG